MYKFHEIFKEIFTEIFVMRKCRKNLYF